MALITVLVVAACGNKAADTDAKSSSKKETVTIKHNSGTTDVPKNPKKSLSSTLECLIRLTSLA